MRNNNNLTLAAALLGTTMMVPVGAFAADAVVVEPEPVDFVRVCDAYGSGFFFIPGTETCIRMGGYVRSGYEKFSIDGDIAGSLVNPVAAAEDPTTDPATLAVVNDANFTLWGNRGRLDVDVRNETDWGTLRAIYRLEGGQSNIDVNVDLDVALLSLAGFRFGFAGANYWSTNHGFGEVNGEDLATNAGFVLYEQGFYGFDDATIADYTFVMDNLAITVGAEDPRLSFNTGGILNATNNGGTDGRVNFYAGLNYDFEFGTFAFTAVHDSLGIELDGAAGIADVGGWALKASLKFEFGDPGNSKITGYWMYDGDYDTDYVSTYRISENPETILGAAFQTNFTNEYQFWANYWYAEGGEAIDGAGIQFVEGDTTQIGVGFNWFPDAAPGFHIKTAYIYGDVEDSGSILYTSSALPRANFEFDAFTVALRRNF